MAPWRRKGGHVSTVPNYSWIGSWKHGTLRASVYPHVKQGKPSSKIIGTLGYQLCCNAYHVISPHMTATTSASRAQRGGGGGLVLSEDLRLEWSSWEDRGIILLMTGRQMCFVHCQ